jgi:dimeric dUTPase (all-alpha-NTP-PPase superfamily)
MKIENYKKIVELQHEFNKQVADDYLDKKFNWNSAIIAESGELLESAGYKWWKKTEIDMDNVKVEAIDLLHFVISDDIQTWYSSLNEIQPALDATIDLFADFFEEIDIYENFENSSILNLIDLLNYDTYERFFVLKQLFKTLNMNNEDVYIAYIVKNCLNKFRQEHGYKEGTYNKMWNNLEDNVVAYELASNIGIKENLFDILYEELASTYSFYFKG